MLAGWRHRCHPLVSSWLLSSCSAEMLSGKLLFLLSLTFELNAEIVLMPEIGARPMRLCRSLLRRSLVGYLWAGSVVE